MSSSSSCHHHHHHNFVIMSSSSSPVSSRVVDLALGVDCKQTSAADGKQIWLGSFRLSVRSSVGSHRGSLLRHQMIAHSLQQQLFTLGSFSHQRLFINIIHQKLSEIWRENFPDMKVSLQSYLGIRGSLTCFRSLKMNFFRSGVSCFIQAIVACNNKEKWKWKGQGLYLTSINWRVAFNEI